MSGKLFTWRDFKRICRAVAFDIPKNDDEYVFMLEGFEVLMEGLRKLFKSPKTIRRFVGVGNFKYSQRTLSVLHELSETALGAAKGFPAGIDYLAGQKLMSLIIDYVPIIGDLLSLLE